MRVRLRVCGRELLALETGDQPEATEPASTSVDGVWLDASPTEVGLGFAPPSTECEGTHR